MKSMIVSVLILLILAALAYKIIMTGGQEAASSASPPSERFMNRCSAVAATEPKPEAYCRCLWDRGIRSVSSLGTSLSARDRAAQCSEAR